MANLIAVAGSKMYIGTRVASKGNVTLSDFEDQAAEWTEVGGWAQAGTVGDTVETISQNFINLNRTLNIKGTRNGAAMENTFSPLPNDPGQIKLKAAEDDCANVAVKIEWGAGCASESVVTVSIADPGVITWEGGHALEAGSTVMLTGEGGTLPTGLLPDTAYYVSATGLTATTFSVSETVGGTPIETTAAGTATSITATAQPYGMTHMFYGLVMPGTFQGGDANTAQLRASSIMVNSNIIEV